MLQAYVLYGYEQNLPRDKNSYGMQCKQQYDMADVKATIATQLFPISMKKKNPCRITPE